ncbi:PPE family protein [Mycobacterium sp. M1]|uniref:PPE family protein n=1 Tax=Mycolicibacter acidiphilus TaxID=2835306 RepID=A0ABS5RK91_9MYCO|nr:PPE family protein [Mycolicibacter acidiphilus]MBS9534656.1 PPE family protein [Mycolicibacter acidiphilus]
MLDFGALPPEINSGLLYVGAGAAPLTEAAASWAALAEELGSAADACAAALSGLTGGAWQGESSASMTAAATRYAGWMRTTAGQAAHAAGQAAAAATAYQTALAAIVPPPAIAANRARLANLLATNVLGQNAAGIAATDGEYTQMWAQDAAAMYRYAGESAAAATLTPLSTPPPATTADAQAGQAAATTQATVAAAGSDPTNLTQVLGQLSGALQALTSPSLDGANIFSPANGASNAGLSGLLNMLSGRSNSALGDLLNAFFGNSVFSSGWWNPTGVFNVFNSFDYLLIYAAQDAAAAQAAESGLGALGPMVSQISDVTPVPPTTAPGAHPVGPGQVSAETGKATLVRSLAVPPKWAALVAPTAGATAALAGSTAAPMSFGAGPTMLPGAPMPGAVRGKSRYARRYGFRPTVTSRPPAGG